MNNELKFNVVIAENHSQHMLQAPTDQATYHMKLRVFIFFNCLFQRSHFSVWDELSLKPTRKESYVFNVLDNCPKVNLTENVFMFESKDRRIQELWGGLIKLECSVQAGG